MACNRLFIAICIAFECVQCVQFCIGKEENIIHGKSFQGSELNATESLQKKFSSLFEVHKFTSASQISVSDEISRIIVSIVEACGGQDLFRDMDLTHMAALAKLKNILRSQKNSEFLKMAKILRDYPGMNYMLWLKGLLSVTLERKELRALRKPNLIQLIPKSFIDSESLQQAMKQARLPQQQQTCVPVDGSLTTYNGIEQVMWYFREDLLANLQHMFWHITHPIDLQIHRKGELFYYFHHNLLARYNAERLANGLSRVQPLNLQEGAFVEEGYFHQLSGMNAVHTWGNRFPNSVLRPLRNVTDCLNLASTLTNDIMAGSLKLTNGTSISINDTKGINIIGDAVECLSFTMNSDQCEITGIHGRGHNLIAYLSENHVGIMESTVLALRDPIFYRWHAFIEDMFQLHKSLLPSYQPLEGELPLLWDGVKVIDIEVHRQGHRHHIDKDTFNDLQTSFGSLNITLPLSVDAQLPSEGFADYCNKRLEHVPFRYKITIERSTDVESGKGTVRIFMAPRFNETGGRFSMDEQRKLFFAMDEFTVDLDIGENVIIRQSIDSSLSLQWSFEDSSSVPPTLEMPDCGCGWPQHLLLPKGLPNGMVYDLFIMVTDGTVDTPEEPEIDEDVCASSHILCGKLGKKYPDARPMGYPFDRKPYIILSSDGGRRMVADLDEYVDSIANMKAVQIRIFHQE